MTMNTSRTPAAIAILALAEIRAATDVFDCGEANVFDALDAVTVSVESYRAAIRGLRSPGPWATSHPRRRSSGDAA